MDITNMETQEANDYLKEQVLTLLRKQENMKYIFIINEEAGKGKYK